MPMQADAEIRARLAALDLTVAESP
jgi:hypothetical protein